MKGFHKDNIAAILFKVKFKGEPLLNLVITCLD